jgi:hypothetical protein
MKWPRGENIADHRIRLAEDANGVADLGPHCYVDSADSTWTGSTMVDLGFVGESMTCRIPGIPAKSLRRLGQFLVDVASEIEAEDANDRRPK